MISVGFTQDVAAPVDVTWEYISNYRNAPHYIDGLLSYESLGPVDRGVGATFAGVLKLGPTKVKVLFEVVEWVEGQRAVFKSKKGLTTTTTYDFTALDDERSRVAVTMSVGGAGHGVLARQSEKLIAPFMQPTMNRTADKVAAGVAAFYTER